MKLEEFLRVQPLRAPNIAWFLGAGASASARVPTAFHMIWDFKRVLYAASEKVSLRALGDIGDPALRRRLQEFFDRSARFPPADSPEEYEGYFQAAYPNDGDRRRYIQARVEGASPSFGHYALAGLMKTDRVRLVWTTNFDRAIEDAGAETFGTTGRLVVGALGEPTLVLQGIAEGRWPILGKLHGDYHSRSLKNVETELREQDARMRGALVESCRRFGLAVVGYSGRDDSVMGAMEEALDGTSPYPFGLFWFHRDDAPFLPRVQGFIDRATARGVQAAAIQIETFDELMGDLLLLEPELPADVAKLLEQKRPSRLKCITVPGHDGTWPVLRFNSLPVIAWPNSCRLVRCGIGGTAEVRKAVIDTGVELLVARRQAGVMCFGRDGDARQAFSSFGVSEFTIHAIEPRRLRYDTAELGLLYDAIGRAIARELPLLFYRGRHPRLAVDPNRGDTGEFEVLRRAVGSVAGTVPASDKTWSEAIGIRLEYKLDRLWFLLEPTIKVHREPGAELDEASLEFIRERLAKRYNRSWAAVLEAWIAVLFRSKGEHEFRAFGLADGIDATFTLSSVTAFSRRLRS